MSDRIRIHLPGRMRASGARSKRGAYVEGSDSELVQLIESALIKLIGRSPETPECFERLDVSMFSATERPKVIIRIEREQVTWE